MRTCLEKTQYRPCSFGLHGSLPCGGSAVVLGEMVLLINSTNRLRPGQLRQAENSTVSHEPRSQQLLLRVNGEEMDGSFSAFNDVIRGWRSQRLQRDEPADCLEAMAPSQTIGPAIAVVPPSFLAGKARTCAVSTTSYLGHFGKQRWYFIVFSSKFLMRLLIMARNNASRFPRRELKTMPSAEPLFVRAGAAVSLSPEHGRIPLGV